MAQNAQKTPWIEVAIGILQRDGEVCLSLRQKHQHLADLWEFPGGKIEPNELPEQALVREFHEELGVKTENWKKLMTVPWHYEKVSVRLHVFTTQSFNGEPHGKEGQSVEWCPMSQLRERSFPEANRGILAALSLPDLYLTIGSFESDEDCLKRFEKALESGVKLAQFKSKGLSEAEFVALGEKLITLAHNHGAKLLLNAQPEVLSLLPDADGIQLSSKQANAYKERPISSDKLLSVSTHNLEGMLAAMEMGADILQLSPIKYTSAHPDIEPIGWQGMKTFIDEVAIPVYALGGMKVSDAQEARLHGAQGVVVTKGLWPDRLS